MQSAQFELHAQIEDRHWWFAGRRQILRAVIERLLPAGQNRLVIDVGCGSGANAAGLADGYRVLGIDASTDAIDHARRRFPDMEFRCGLAPADVSDCIGAADMVTLNDVLEHVEDAGALLRQIVEAVSPGCIVLITVPADMTLWSPHDEAFGHFRRYCSRSLRDHWHGLPCSELLLSHFNARLEPAVRAVRALSRWRGAAAGSAGTDFALPSTPVNALLRGVFAGESRRLLSALAGRSRPYSRGVSLLAVLQKIGRTSPVAALQPC